MSNKSFYLQHKLAAYQHRWLKLMDDDTKRWVAILAARGAAKTWTVALWVIRRLFTSKRQVTLIPGGSEEQGSQIMSYIKEILIVNPFLFSLVKAWSATRLEIKNGSVFKIKPPTPSGTQSARGDIIVEEAGLLKREIAELLMPIASKKENRIILIGTPYKGSWFEDQWNTIENRDEVHWEDAVSAGVVDIEAVDDARKRMSAARFQSQYECQWVDESGYHFKVVAVNDVEHLVTAFATGVDPNLNPGYAWVKVVQDAKGRLIAVDEGVFHTLSDIGTLDGIIMLEDNGVQRLIYQEALIYNQKVVSDGWDGESKDANVDKAKILGEKGNLFIIKDKCRCLMQGLNEIVFDTNGKINKAKSGKFMHYVDAWLHALNGVGGSIYESISLFYNR